MKNKVINILLDAGYIIEDIERIFMPGFEHAYTLIGEDAEKIADYLRM